MGKLIIVDHPLVKHKITLLRSKHTDVQVFRQLMQELSMLLAYEATRSIPVENTTCETPLMQAESPIKPSLCLASNSLSIRGLRQKPSV